MTHTKVVHYHAGDTELQGFLAHNPEIKTKSPAVMIAHAWRGLDEFTKNKAVQLAQLGYIAFAADVYGNGKVASTDDEAKALMSTLYQNRKLLLERIRSGYEMIKNHPLVDPKKIGGIGFCFGGLTILELFLSGAEMKGVVSFHGALSRKETAEPIASNIKGSVLLLHGQADPLVPLEDVLAIQKELTEAKIDWEMDIYGHAYHAFTNPEAHDQAKGLVYNEKANYRSWKAMFNFFNEIF